MSTAVKQFNALTDKISYQETERLANLAKEEGQKILYARLSNALKAANGNKEMLFSPGRLALEEVPEFMLPALDEMPDYITPEEFTGLNKAVSPDEIYQYITDMVINTIRAKGHLPWHKGWKDSVLASGQEARNFDTQRPYRGINFFLLNFGQGKDEEGNPIMEFIKYENPNFLTFKSIERNGGKLKEGSKSHKVIYFTVLYLFQWVEEEKNKQFGTYTRSKAIEFVRKNQHILPELESLKTGKTKRMGIESYVDQNTVPVLKYYNVFNGGDVEGIDFDIPKGRTEEWNDHEKIEVCEAIVKNMPNPPKIEYRGNQPAYYPMLDSILMTPLKQFDNPEEYYSTLFHELTHSTGHSKRLNRGNDTRKRDGSEADKKAYDFEELVAEMGAVFLCAESGILFQTIDSSAKYLNLYKTRLVKRMKEDNRFFFRAASASQAAADYMLDRDKDGVPAYMKELSKIDKTKKEEKKKGKKQPEKPMKKEKANVSPLYRAIPKSKQNIRGMLIDPENRQSDTLTWKEWIDKTINVDKHSLLKRYANFNFRSGDYRFFRDKDKFYLTVDGKNKRAIHEEVFMYVKEEVYNPKNDKPEAKTKQTKKSGKDFPLILEYPIEQIHLDEKRFQNRSKLNQNVVANIVKNFTATQFDPVVVWTDPKNKKVYLLAGHHRMEAYKQMNKENIPVKFADKDYPTEKEAIKYARQLSNANRTLETPQERAKIYREMSKSGESKKAIEKAAEIENKNKNYILNLAALNDKGQIIEAMERFAESPDKQTEKEVERMADWIGQARRNFPQLTDTHETEMWKFLNDKNASKRTTNKSDFLQRILSIAGGFDFEPSQPLNLNRIKYESEGERFYNEEYSRLQTKIQETQDKIAGIKARFSDPNNPQFVNPKAKDYSEIQDRATDQIAKLNAEIKKYQSELIELSRNKSKITAAGQTQGSLFGTKSKKKGLKSPDTREDGNSYSGEGSRPRVSGRHPKVKSINHRSERAPMFAIAGETSKFLQAVEKKPVDSVVVTLDGPQGGGKTTALYKFMNDFARAGNKCLFASLEEHPSSNLAHDKRERYLFPEAQANIDTVAEFSTYTEFVDIAQYYDAIFIDSWQKLVRMIGNIRLDEDVRKKFDGKVFFIIFQQTTTGRTKGGAEIVFDGDIIIKIEKTAQFSDNFAYFDKNRYTTIPTDNLKYMIDAGMTIIDLPALEEESDQEPARPELPEPTQEEFTEFIVY